MNIYGLNYYFSSYKLCVPFMMLQPQIWDARSLKPFFYVFKWCVIIIVISSATNVCSIVQIYPCIQDTSMCALLCPEYRGGLISGVDLYYIEHTLGHFEVS